MSQYRRHSIVPLDGVLPFVIMPEQQAINRKAMSNNEARDATKKDYGGLVVKMASQRLQMFVAKGIVCARCGIEGKYFALEQDKYMPNQGSNAYHFNLYALDGAGNEVLMTKDHIVPICSGGSNELSNYQTMCSPCNGSKGANNEERKVD